MTVHVVVGYGGGDTHRRRARRWVVRRYLGHGYPVTVGRCRGAWVKAAAFNAAASRGDSDVLVLADADSFVTRQALADAVAAAPDRGWVVPASTVRRLTRSATGGILAADPTAEHAAGACERVHGLLAGGGIVVLTRDLWRTVGGFDPRFVGWGGEDYALGCALYAHAGPAHQLPGTLWHLWHPPAVADPRIGPRNVTLATRYRAARHDRAAMTALIDEWRHDGADHRPTGR